MKKLFFLLPLIFLFSALVVIAVPLKITVTNDTLTFETDDGQTNSTVPNTPFLWALEVNNTVIENIIVNTTIEQVFNYYNTTQETIQIMNYTYECPVAFICPSCPPQAACQLTCPPLSCPEFNVSEITCVVNESLTEKTENATKEVVSLKEFFVGRFENVTVTQMSEAQKRERTTIVLLVLLIIIAVIGIVAYFGYKVYVQKKGGSPTVKLTEISEELRKKKEQKDEVIGTKEPEFKIDI